MKIIWMNIPAHGHVNPTLPIVEGVVAHGAEVLYYNAEEFRAKISATGASFRAYPVGGMTGAALANAVSDHLIDVTLLLFETSLTLTGFMVDEIAREQPDLLIFDSICLWGMQAARVSGVPSIASITTFIQEGVKRPMPWRDWLHMAGNALVRVPRFLKARSALIQRYGRASLPEKHIFPCTGQLNLVYTIRELQPPTPFLDASFRFVGPSLGRRSQEPAMTLPEGRIIYISLGTIHTTNPRFFATCFEAFADLPATFVLSAGEMAQTLTAPSNFIVRAHVPQLALLQRADLFITHAGINSLHESLYYGVPMVMLPQQMEQAMNARIAERHNVGILLGGNPPYGQGVTAATLAAAVEEVLQEARYRDAAQRMSELLQATDGTAEAITAILGFGTMRGKEGQSAIALAPVTQVI